MDILRNWTENEEAEEDEEEKELNLLLVYNSQLSIVNSHCICKRLMANDLIAHNSTQFKFMFDFHLPKEKWKLTTFHSPYTLNIDFGQPMESNTSHI